MRDSEGELDAGGSIPKNYTSINSEWVFISCYSLTCWGLGSEKYLVNSQVKCDLNQGHPNEKLTFLILYPYIGIDNVFRILISDHFQATTCSKLTSAVGNGPLELQ